VIKEKIFLRKIKGEILETIFKYTPKENCSIFLFGSFAQNKVYPSSDIDIGFISDEPLKNSLLVKIKEELGQLKTLRDIDLIDFTDIQDRDFLKVSLGEVKIWHQTKKSKIYLNNLRKLILD
jgi:predicted nucleotidyltransferase